MLDGNALNAPNFISICRFILVPVVVYLIATGEFLAAFWVFVVAGVSDGVDGFIAKRFNQVTEFGAYLDPLADKALLVSIYVSLGLIAEMPLWLVILVASRDLFIVCAVILSWMLDRPVTMAPLLVSKANTVFQITLAAIALGDLGFSLDLAGLRQALVWLVAALTVASALAYCIDWLRHMAGAGEMPQEGGETGS